MVQTVRTSPSLSSPFKEKFNFDWFSFETRGSGVGRTPRLNASSPVTPLGQSSPRSVNSASMTVSPATPTSATPHPSVVKLPSPPNKPLAWVWQCHQCRSRYPLAVTRRCLIDGHYYCSGDSQSTTATATKNLKRRKKAASCTSEFDYVGWAQWGTYRRKCMALRAYANDGFRAEVKLKGCLGCSFPSQCRYENRPPVESIDPKKYVDGADVADVQEMAKLVQVTASPTSPRSRKIANTSAKRESDKSGTSFGQRFYSSLTGTFSSSDLHSSSIGETSTKNMESSSTPTKSNNVISKADLEDSLLPAIEKKMVRIAEENDDSSHGKQNSFLESTTAPSHELQRTASNQSLLTDFSQQASSTNTSTDTSDTNTSTGLTIETEPTTPPPAIPAPTFQSSGKSSSRTKWNRPSTPLPPSLVLQGKDFDATSSMQEINVTGLAGASANTKNANNNSGSGIGYVLGGFGYGKKK